MQGCLCSLFLYIQMSSITANVSLREIEANTHSHPKRMRQYKKVSHSNLDNTSVEAYLRSQKFLRTLVVFQEEVKTERSCYLFLKMWEQGAASYSGKIQELWKEVEKTLHKNPVAKEDAIRLELYFYIWFSIGEEGVLSHRAKELKDFIKSKGEQMSEIPELIPYFVLPYLAGGTKNSILRKIQSTEWKTQAKTLLLKCLGISVDSPDQQWVNIIKDLIQICERLVERLNFDRDDSELAKMLARVGQYKKVIQNNLAKGVQHSQIDNGRQELMKLNQQKGQSSNEGIDRIYNNLNLQLRKRAKEGTDKQFVSFLLRQDVLLLEGQCIPHQSSQWLCLLQTFSSYYCARQQLLHYPQLFQLLLSAFRLELDKFQGGEGAFRILAILQIFERCLQSKGLARLILSMEQLPKTVLELIFTFGPLYPQCSTSDAHLFERVLNCTLAIVLHRQGRALLSSMKLIDLISIIFKKLPINGSPEVESVVCSICYLVLVEESLRREARRVGFREALLERKLNRDVQCFDSVADLLLERIDCDGHIQELDSDEDNESQNQLDDINQFQDQFVMQAVLRLTPPNYEREKYRFQRSKDKF